jgi:hypothetical protein
MKKIFLIGALMGAGTLAAHSQTIATMAEQLIELKIFEQTTANGYQLMSSGVDSISQITDAEYQLHLNYFGSLDLINPNLGADPSIIDELNNLALEIKKLLYD